MMRPHLINRWLRGKSWNAVFGEGPVVPVPGVCERAGCDGAVIGKRHKRFCSPTCREKDNTRRYNAKLKAQRHAAKAASAREQTP